MAIQTNFPAIKPTLLLDFANTEQLDPRITFTRASTATYYGTQTAKAEENLLLQSQTFDNASWATQGITTTANTSTAPDGTTTADTITETVANSAHRTEQTVATSGTVTLSVFAKLGSGTRFLTIGVSRDATHASSATFDLSLGTNTQTRTDGGVYSSASATITSVAQGFYRCTLTVTTDTCNTARLGLNDTGTPSSGNRGFGAGYTGDGTSSLILWGAQLEQRSAVTAYTPTTTQAITNYIPRLLTAASGVARFDHNPTTFESLGLEIEESRTNLVTYSEQFETGWSRTATALTANAAIAPDGALTADWLREGTGANFQNNFQTLSQTATTYAFSIYVKKGQSDRFVMFAGSPQALIWIDMTTWTVYTSTNAVSSSLTPVGNGWYRCTLVYTNTASGSYQTGVNLVQNGSTNVVNFAGNGWNGIYIWGAQLEAGAFATSYIPTVASQVTRAADAASMTGTNFSSWYNAAEGAVYVEAATSNTSATSAVAAFSDGGSNNRWQLNKTSTATIQGFASTNGANDFLQSLSPIVANVFFKSSFAIAANNTNTALNGISGTTDTSVLVPVVTQLDLGQRASASFLNGTIRKIAYYPIRVTNSQLQALTS